jgi:predicted transcriptional regulator
MTKLVAEIVTSYVANHQFRADEIPALIRSVADALAGVSQPTAAALPSKAEPAVPVKKSVAPDYIVCLEDGRRLKMLKRYLRTTYNMTPDDYRAKWGLPTDYPMVAPNYAAARSEMAKTIGLGTKGRGRGPGRPLKR